MRSRPRPVTTGAAFAGLSGNTNFYNLMLAGACGQAVPVPHPVMAMAGNLVKKKIVPASAGLSRPTDRCLSRC